jgi:hypothetical protein
MCHEHVQVSKNVVAEGRVTVEWLNLGHVHVIRQEAGLGPWESGGERSIRPLPPLHSRAYSLNTNYEDRNPTLLSPTAMPDDDRGSLLSIQSLHASPDSITSKFVSSWVNLIVGELAVDA